MFRISQVRNRKEVIVRQSREQRGPTAAGIPRANKLSRGDSRRTFLLQSGGLVAASVLTSNAGGLTTSQPSHTIVEQSASDMVRLLKTKELSPVELLELHIERFSKVQSKINAVTHTAFASALRRAQAAERMILDGLADWRSRPLFGIPFSVKNHIDVTGIPTTAAAPAWSENYPKSDADVVRRLRSSGAIFFAATSLPCLSISVDTESRMFGRTNNPYDLRRSVGGSSGGEGALIAAGGSPIGVGSDHNGSIRLPSAWNGIVGLRPAPGRLSLAGFQPAVPQGQHDEWTMGPMARRVEDLELALPAFLAETSNNGVPPLKDSRRVELKRLRVQYFTKWNHGYGEPIREIQDAVVESAKWLETQGAGVEEGLPEILHRIGEVIVALMLGNDGFSVPDFKKTAREVGAQEDESMMRIADWVDKWQRTVPLRTQRANAGLFPTLQRAFFELMEHVDALVLPVHASTALMRGDVWPWNEGERVEEKYSYVYFCRLLGQHPAGTIPVGITDRGLPVAVQVVGRKYREDIVLRVMSELEARFGGWKPARGPHAIRP